MLAAARPELGPIMNMFNLFYGITVPDWILRISNKRLSSQAKLLYGRLLRYMGKGGQCNPRLATLADQLGCCVRTINNALAELRKEGLVTTIRRMAHLEFRFHWHNAIRPEDIKDLDTLKKRLVEGGYDITAEDLFQGRYNKGCISLEGGPPPKPVEICNTCTSEVQDLHEPPFNNLRESEERESLLKSPTREPKPKVFSSGLEESGPSPKLTSEPASEASRLPADANDGEQPADRLEAARAREAALRARVSNPKENSTKRKLAQREVVKNSARSEISHTEDSHNLHRSKAAAARRAQEPSYRSFSDIRQVWVEEAQKLLPDLPVAPWRPTREGRYVKELMRLYQGADVEKLIRYVLGNWPALRRRFFKGKGGPVPTLPTLLRFHDCWIAEAIVWEKSIKTVRETEQWMNKNSRRPTADVWKSYQKAKNDLVSLDLEN